MSRIELQEICQLSESRSKQSFPQCQEWSTADWFIALFGEVGEAANIVKKIKRDGPSDELKKALAKELADILGYLPNVAASIGVNLADEFVEKFNEVSDRVDSPIKINW